MKIISQLAAIIILVSSSLPSLGQDQRTIMTTAKWVLEKNTQGILIDVSDALSPAQQDIVNSGFSTFTLLAIRDGKIQGTDTPPDLRVVCSVKYDTWEERYQAVRVEPLPLETMTFKEYKDWARKCLQITVTSVDVLSKLKAGGQLSGLLQIRQSSPDESAKIKNWLVRQQSGFMQGLYAHMLGDIQFQGSVKLNINVPSLKVTELEAPREVTPSRKKEGLR